MSNAATLNSMTALVRAWLNLTSVATVSDADIKVMLRSSLSQLYEKLVGKHRDQYLAPPHLISLVADQPSYALPQDFRGINTVFLTFAQGTVNQANRELLPFTMRDWKALRLRGILPPHPFMYKLVGVAGQGNRLLIQPTPTAGYEHALEVWYIPQFQGPVRDTDTIDSVLPNGWERWAALDTCVQMAARMKLPEVFQMFGVQLKEAETLVMEAASIRDENAPPMTDVYDGDASTWEPGQPGSI